ncbi:hypothetical protein FHU38_001197 [Saccharomonospora amisosensis]|uniref:Secreted protein n=1 Tax=Saccharomonospora amisosensis TaxID=1128677 RepID=A0A7X5ZPJ3_9PSEU|nr:hypothetical protein [Saccharomonospora amisosensis]NIJ10853.1 hypothetical protein [Saccharomonospora amisosensis]
MRGKLRGMVVVTLFTGTLVGAGQAALAQADPPPLDDSPIASSSTSDDPETLASRDVSVYAYDSANQLRGSGHFTAHGEHLYACDERSDGSGVTAYLYWDGATRASVGDSNGAASGCGHRNLSIAENTTVWLAVCAEGLGCTDWYRGEA